MTDLREELRRLELSQYLEVLVAEGFDSWEAVSDIRESDLNSLNVKLVHRRACAIFIFNFVFKTPVFTIKLCQLTTLTLIFQQKLQRAIAEWWRHVHNYRSQVPLSKDTGIHGSHRNDDYPLSCKWTQGITSAFHTASGSTKRKYRRRPKPDEHAPERPPTAYVIFSKHERKSLKSHVLTFAEIAKVVGGRWQNLPAEAQGIYHRQANAGKEQYYAKIVKYKKSSEYAAYQKYLKEFKTKHTASRKEDIRSKSETPTSTLTRSSTHGYGDRSSNSIICSDELSSLSMGHDRTEHSYPSESAFPVTHSLTGLNSPSVTDPSSRVSASQWSAAVHQESGAFFPSSNAPEFSRVLPPPVQSLEPASSALDLFAPFSSHTQQPIELRPLSPFAELLRAGDLARIAHEAIDKARHI